MATKLRAKPIIYSVPSNDIKRSREFYAKMLGVELAPSLTKQYESYNASISDDGIDLTVNQRHTQHDTPMMYFAVDDLKRALAEAEGLGATVVWGPQDLRVDEADVARLTESAKRESSQAKGEPFLGRGAVLIDPGGSQFGLMELAAHVHGHFRYTKSAARS